jgi:hypothetical protein
VRKAILVSEAFLDRVAVKAQLVQQRRTGSPSLTVFFWANLVTPLSRKIPRIDQSIPIVAETEQIADRRNSLLKSRGRIFDGLGSRFFAACKNIALINQRVIIT